MYLYSLDAALAKLIPRLDEENLDDLRAVVLANNETLMTEMQRRERFRKANLKSRIRAKRRR